MIAVDGTDGPGDRIELRPLCRAEVDVVVDWAAGEGWNPGLADAQAFWDTDPEGFLGADVDGELAAAGSIVSYGGELGFMGFFIVRPELRGRGLGRAVWLRRRDALLGRLRPGAPIGMDGVFAMQHFYERGGFRLSHRNFRMRGLGRPNDAAAALTRLVDLPFDMVAAYDAEHFGVARPGFLRAWIDPAGGHGLGHTRDAELRGLGVVRPCREGFKIGPLFADDPAIADELLLALTGSVGDAPVYLDIPEVNAEAVRLAARHGMTEVFGCARMYLGGAPQLPWGRIFGVTTFELG